MSLTTMLALWAAIGPLLGIILGHVLSRSSQQRQWQQDNRKQEYRELLDALSAAYSEMVEYMYGDFHDSKELFIKHKKVRMETFRILQNRIWIAKELKAANIEQEWGITCRKFDHDKDAFKFRENFDALVEKLVNLAVRDGE